MWIFDCHVQIYFRWNATGLDIAITRTALDYHNTVCIWNTVSITHCIPVCCLNFCSFNEWANVTAVCLAMYDYGTVSYTELSFEMSIKK